MKSFYSAVIGAVCIAIIFFAGCTDVPISENKIPDDPRIFGYWQNNDSVAYQIEKKSDGSAYMVQLKYKPDKKSYRVNEVHGLVTFATLDSKSGKKKFLSFLSSEGYQTLEYIFENEYLVTRNVSDFFLGETHEKDDDGKVIFKTSENYKNFVAKNIDNPDLFEKTVVKYAIRKSPKDFSKPQ